jgi:hypothetical protein
MPQSIPKGERPINMADQCPFCEPDYVTVSVFRAKSSDLQQYQLATEVYGRHGAAMAWAVALSGRSSIPY